MKYPTISVPSSLFSSCLSVCTRPGSLRSLMACDITMYNAFSITNMIRGLQIIPQVQVKLAWLCPGHCNKPMKSIRRNVNLENPRNDVSIMLQVVYIEICQKSVKITPTRKTLSIKLSFEFNWGFVHICDQIYFNQVTIQQTVFLNSFNTWANHTLE